jgi:cholesterol transport system auxiliary component
MLSRRGRGLKSIALTSGVLALSIALSGCALLGGGSKPLDTYELTSPSVGERRGRSSYRQILIAEPSALKALDGENIVIAPSPGSIQYLKGAQWADRLPKIVQARLAETFQRSGEFRGVGRPGEGLAIDYQVILDIRAFEIRVNGVSEANVELFVRLLNDRNGTVRAEKTFSASAPVSSAGNAAYVRALDAAFGQAVVEIVAWTGKTI